tara:strand:- start:40 stop:753 length:714 start_codon:yes stop_codon:yes gene_type:complete
MKYYLEKFLYKKLSPMIGKIADKLFLTNISKRGTNFYHYYQQNDYIFKEDQYCLIAVPKTGGWSFRMYTEKYNLPFYKFKKNALHNAVSLNCPTEKYKYVTILRNPIDRVYSHYHMYLIINDISTSRGLINFLRTCSEVKNLYCQYYSGLIDEVVDERIYNIALKNLKNFNTVIDFENYFADTNKFLKSFNFENKEEIHQNKNRYPSITKSQIDAIKIYNYWDIKLYNEILSKNISY